MSDKRFPVSRGRAIACIPCTRPQTSISTLIAVCSQTRPPDRVIVRDCSVEGLSESGPLLRGLTKWLAIEVHRAPADENLATTRRRLVDDLEHDDWAWFVDDDIVPWHDCLEKLVEAVEEHEVAMASGVKQDLVRFPMPDVPLGWVRGEDRRMTTMHVPCCPGDLYLVHAGTYRQVDHSYQLSPEFPGGEDIVVSAQIAARYGLVVTPHAVGLHLRDKPSPWMKQGGHDRDRLVANLTGRLSQEQLDRFLARVGLNHPGKDK